MELEQRLRTQIQGGVARQPEVLAPLRRRDQPGTVVIGERAQIVQQEQPLAVMLLGIGGLEQIVGDPVVEVRDAGGVGMPERNTLYRREARKGEKVGEGVHTDV